MSNEELFQIVLKDYKLSDYSSFTKEVPYDVRVNLFEKEMLYNKDGENVYYYCGHNGLFSNLFTMEEAKRLIDNYSNLEKRSIIILNLDDEEKIKYVDELAKNTKFENDSSNGCVDSSYLNMIISSFHDQDIRTKFILKFLDGMQNFDVSFYLTCVKSLPSKYVSKTFDKVIELHSRSDKNIINEYFFLDILEILPDSDKKDVLFKALKLNDNENKNESTGKRTGIFKRYISAIVKAIPPEEQLDTIKEILKYKDETGIEIPLSDLLVGISKENFKEGLIIISKRYNLDDIYIEIPYMGKNSSQLRWYIDKIIEVENEIGKKILNGSKFATIVRSYSSDVNEELFRYYVFEKKIFDFEETIISFQPLVRYKLIDEAIQLYLNKGNSISVIYNFIDKRIINRNDTVPYPDGSIMYNNINNIYIKESGLNPNNFQLFVERFGYCGLKYVSNNNIIKTLKMDEVSFKKYLDIFDINNTKLNNDDVNTICNALYQREFRLRESDDYNIFSRIEKLLSTSDMSTERELISILGSINKYVNLDKYIDISIEEFVIRLYNYDRESINILHNITNKYIAIKREIYSKNRLANIQNELHLNKKISKQYYKKKYLELFGIGSLGCDLGIVNSNLSKEQLYLLDDMPLLERIYEFKRNPNNVQLDNKEKKYLKVFESLLNILYENQAASWRLEGEDTEYDYMPYEATNDSLIGIMLNIDPDIIKTNILFNDKIYNELIGVLKKYHLLGWNDTFNSIMPLSDITFNDGTLASIISYFNEILSKIKGSSAYLTKLLDYGNIYDSTSIMYRLLMGSEDYSLLSANGGKNKSSMARHNRLKCVPKFIKKMYAKKYVTVPPMDKDIELSNNKKINVVVGNSTNMMNLTYGERTNSCLRIGGAFYDLFRYCIESEFGFHIRFTNPSNNKFVSRVSGIRNGNTLFLNELSDSVDEEYSNLDLYDAIKRVASELVEMSKNSFMPIDNVIITSDYALRDHESEEKNLYIDNIKKALRNLNFNITDNKGIILKTSNIDNSIVEYKFTDYVPKYEVEREKIQIYYGEDANNKVIQIMMINELLGGKKIDEIEIKPVNYRFCICSSDWFIGVSNDDNITKYVMPNSSNVAVATIEMNNTLEKLEQKKKEANFTNIGGIKR